MITFADTGALVALLDRSDVRHPWALRCFQSLKPPLLTCEVVLAETWHLLQKAPPSCYVLAAMHRDGILRSDFHFEQHPLDVWKLLQKYTDTPMDFADACLVRLTEIVSQSRVWTTDSNFKVYRRLGRQTVPVLAPWQ